MTNYTPLTTLDLDPKNMEVPTTEIPTVAYTSSSGGNKMFSKKNILLILFLLVIVIALPVGLYLVQKTQIFRSKAASGISEVVQFSVDSGITKKKPADANDLTYSTNKADTTLVTMTLNPDADILKTLLPDTDNAGGTAPTATQPPTATNTPAATPTTLATPTNLTRECKDNKLILGWKAVDGAVKYWVVVTGAGSAKEATTNRLEIENVPEGNIDWNVTAVSATGMSGKAVGNPITCKAAPAPAGATPTDEPATGNDSG